MLLYLHASETFHISETTEIVFDGLNLRTYLNGNEADTRKANFGEVYYVQSGGKGKVPKITKAVLPENRGERIAWALSFIGEKKLATSFDDFLIKYQTYVKHELTYQTCMFFSNSEPKQYAILLEMNPNGRLPKPALAWIDDNISSKEMNNLIETFVKYRDLFCPIDFLKLL